MLVRERLASYIATSARWTSVCTSVPCSGQWAIPMLASSTADDAVERERARERVLQAAGELGGHPAVGQPAQEHGELVAAEPRERVAAAHDALQARGDLLQQAVAGVVAERVVDLLEAVEVDEQQRGGLAAALGRGQRGLHAVVEQRAVGEVGQVVVQGLVAQPARGDGDDPEQRRVEEQRGRRRAAGTAGGSPRRSRRRPARRAGRPRRRRRAHRRPAAAAARRPRASGCPCRRRSASP